MRKQFWVDTWFERDRSHVALYHGFGLAHDVDPKPIVQWWDEDVRAAVEDGFLNPRDWLGSAVTYARTRNLKAYHEAMAADESEEEEDAE